jgi:3-hydroxybutyryl-CoA dehydrogenase
VVAKVERIGVAGAGTMGAGIAQAAVLGGLETVVKDPDEAALARGIERVRTGLAKGAERERWSEDEANRALERLTPGGTGVESLAGSDLVIEAAPEDLELKRELFAALAETCGPEAVLATNTSSLSVTAIAAATPGPERVVGMHFFNPPTLMELVEVVAGDDSSDAALDAATETARRMGKTPIRARDSVGFVGNRCLRPFTLEALRMLGEGLGSHEEIDRVYRRGGGFRMGPFELMDLIGVDVNFAVARSFYEQSFGEPRWRPHPIQARMVAAGRLGRKIGRGFYSYEGERHREPDPDVEAERPLFDDDELERVAGPLGPRILGRLGAQIANEACFALAEGVASAGDINTAMRLGFNWPLGPLEWGERLGWARAVGTLEELRETHGEAYLSAPLLRRLAFGDTEALDG